MSSGFRTIAADLRGAIERGEYRPGDRLPTEHELAERYGVNRGTVNRALSLLRADGLVESARSLGTRVALPPVRLTIARYQAVTDPARPSHDLGPWETACAEQGIDGRMDLLDVTREPADALLAAALDVDQGAPLVRRSRRMWAAGRTVGAQDAWMPADLVEGTPLAAGGKVVGGVYAAMTTAGIIPTSADEVVTARPATGDERDRLALGDAGSVLEVWHHTRDQHGRTVETVRVVLDARRVTLVYGNMPLKPFKGET